MKISKGRLFLILFLLIMLGVHIYNLGVVDWFRTYSLDQVLINKVQDNGVDRMLLVHNPDTSIETDTSIEDPQVIQNFLNSFDDVRLRKIKDFHKNGESMGYFYMFTDKRDHTEQNGLYLYGENGIVKYLEVMDAQKTKNALSSYKIIGGNVDYRAIKEVISQSKEIN